MNLEKLNVVCSKAAKRNLTLLTDKNFYYQQSIIVCEVIKKAVLNNMNDMEINAEIHIRFKELDIESEVQKQALADEAYDLIVRYLHSDFRELIMNNKSIDIKAFGITKKINPHAIVKNENTIEIIKYRMCTPDIGKSTSDIYKLELYLMYLYGATLVPVGSKITVKASYYFLKKTSDKSGDDACQNDEDFFKNKKGYPTGNVVFIQDTVDKTEDPLGKKNELDERFEIAFNQYKKGITEDDISEDDCKKCSMRHNCNYKEAPKLMDTKESVKSIKDLSLNKNQEDAINFSKGIARINAGAGSGKTLVVALRYAMLVSNGVSPKEILMLTFTNAGAREMKKRVISYCDEFGIDINEDDMYITTFNGFANSIVQKNYALLGFSEPPELIDYIEKADIVSKILNADNVEGLDYKNYTLVTKYVLGALFFIIRCFEIIKKKNYKGGDGNLLKADLNTFGEKYNCDYKHILNLYASYDEFLMKENLIEYADQERLMFVLLDLITNYFDTFKFKHIIIDEFQDSDENQINTLKKLIDTKYFQSAMVVGDDSQSIFSFRDTSPEYIINYFDILNVPKEERYDFYLLDNYRSTGNIINLANAINQKNIHRVEKDIISKRESGKMPIVKGFYDKDSEYEYIAECIRKNIKDGIDPNNIAFIAMSNPELVKLEDKLRERNVPCVLMNPEKYLDNEKVIATISLMKAINNPDENTEAQFIYLNVLYDNHLLEKSDDEINNLILSLTERIKMINEMPEEDTKKEYHDMVNALNTDEDEVFEAFLDKIKKKGKKSFEKEKNYVLAFEKYGDREGFKREKNYYGVTLVTAHSSKGLEWDIVYNSVSGYHKQDLGNGKDFPVDSEEFKKVEEMRRLLFVSITRARNELYLTGQYTAFGSKAKGYTENIFLKELYDILDKENYNPKK